jgi:hypothetical protein
MQWGKRSVERQTFGSRRDNDIQRELTAHDGVLFQRQKNADSGGVKVQRGRALALF